jgi:hypothetical protein
VGSEGKSDPPISVTTGKSISDIKLKHIGQFTIQTWKLIDRMRTSEVDKTRKSVREITAKVFLEFQLLSVALSAI